jgi:hypothetical protein
MISPVSACMFVGGLVEAIKHSMKEERGLTTKYELISALGLLLLFGTLLGN